MVQICPISGSWSYWGLPAEGLAEEPAVVAVLVVEEPVTEEVSVSIIEADVWILFRGQCSFLSLPVFLNPGCAPSTAHPAPPARRAGGSPAYLT